MGNEDAFVECHRALSAGDVVAIFPEGTTHDRPRIDPIKTGAARIALGARATGAERAGHRAGRASPSPTRWPCAPRPSCSSVVPIDLDVASPAAVRARGPRGRPPAHRGHRPRPASGEPRLPRHRDGRRPRAGRPADPQQPRRPRPVPGRALRAGPPTGPGRSRGRAGRRPAGGRALHDDAHTDCASPTPTSSAPPTPPVWSDPPSASRSCWWCLGGVVAATFLVNVWPALLVATGQPAGADARLPRARCERWWAWWRSRRRGSPPQCSPPTARCGCRWWCSPAAAGAVAAVWLVERAMALARMLLRWQAQRERVGTVGPALAVRAEVVDAVRVGGRAVTAVRPRGGVRLRVDPPGPDRPACQHAQQPGLRGRRRAHRPVGSSARTAGVAGGGGGDGRGGPGQRRLPRPGRTPGEAAPRRWHRRPHRGAGWCRGSRRCRGCATRNAPSSPTQTAPSSPTQTARPHPPGPAHRCPGRGGCRPARPQPDRRAAVRLSKPPAGSRRVPPPGRRRPGFGGCGRTDRRPTARTRGAARARPRRPPWPVLRSDRRCS